MPSFPVLTTPRLVLRAFRLADAAMVQRLCGAFEVADTTANIPHPYEDGMAEEWIATHEPLWREGKLATFAITLPDDSLVGAVGLRLERHRRAELGYWIGVPHWGQGYATEASVAMVAFGFDTLGLERIHASHFSRNPASGRVMQKVGMILEGVSRRHYLKGGRFEDIVRYAILRDDPRPEPPR